MLMSPLVIVSALAFKAIVQPDDCEPYVILRAWVYQKIASFLYCKQ